MTIPQWPILFYKPFTALNTPNNPIPISAGYQTQGNFTSSMDWETELVVVMKTAAYNISEDEALDHVLGYSVGDRPPCTYLQSTLNDASNRLGMMSLTAVGRSTEEDYPSRNTLWAKARTDGHLGALPLSRRTSLKILRS